MIKLSSGDVRATVDPAGAYLSEFYLQDSVNTQLVYPKQEIVSSSGKKKIRGGSHVCFPNFGPDATAGFAQHGIGRVLPWEIFKHDAGAVSLKLVVTSSVVEKLRASQPAVANYENVEALLTYSITDKPTTLETTFLIENKSSKELRFAPGFHPYFQLQPGSHAERVIVQHVGGASHEVGACNPSYEEAFDANSGIVGKFSAEDRVAFDGLHVTRVTYWSDDPETFICIEPTAFGATFEIPGIPSASELLKPGQQKEYSMKAIWSGPA